MNPTRTSHCRRVRQKGTALVIALVFLLLMTMLGLASMRGASMQERMAGNLRDRNLAFQAAESALRAAEAWLEPEGNAAIANEIPRLSDPATWGGTLSGKAAALSGSQLVDLDNQLAAQPVFHVATPRLALEAAADPQESKVRSFYVITAYAVGGSDTARVILQSHCERPCNLQPISPGPE